MFLELLKPKILDRTMYMQFLESDDRLLRAPGTFYQFLQVANACRQQEYPSYYGAHKLCGQRPTNSVSMVGCGDVSLMCIPVCIELQPSIYFDLYDFMINSI